jgi:hypothetical protein
MGGALEAALQPDAAGDTDADQCGQSKKVPTPGLRMALSN